MPKTINVALTWGIPQRAYQEVCWLFGELSLSPLQGQDECLKVPDGFTQVYKAFTLAFNSLAGAMIFFSTYTTEQVKMSVPLIAFTCILHREKCST